MVILPQSSGACPKERRPGTVYSRGVNPSKVYRAVALERLACPEQLDRLAPVADSQAWIMLVAVAVVLALVVTWACVARIASQVSAPGILIPSASAPIGPAPGALTALVFVATDQGPLVRAGMPARIASAAFPVEAAGTLSGRVRVVAPYPSSAAQMTSLVHNAELARLFGSADAPYAVWIDVEGGGHGGGFAPAAGMTVTATIDYRTQAPIGLVLPALARAQSTVR